MLRLLGNVKRLPALLLGSTSATRFRMWLYASPIKNMFQTRQLKRVIGGGALLYLVGIVAFAWYLASSLVGR